jgi:hypothetical protein
MLEHNHTPNNLGREERIKDTNLNNISSKFELKKNGFGIENLKIESEQILKHCHEINNLKTNLFPLEAFPKIIQEIIHATKEGLNFPIDFTGASFLYAVSVAIGNTCRVEVRIGWLESAAIYLAIVGRAGTNKSHPLSFALQPILDLDNKTYRQYEKQKHEYEKAIISTKKEREKQGFDEPIKPVWNKFLLSDFTPEALAEVHKHNKRGIGVYVDELAGWFKNFNRYNKGSEMEFWLSVWSGKPINIDRKTGEPVFIPKPFISVCGTIQNGILNELAKESRTQNGFIDRILFVIPDNMQKEYWSETDLSSDVSANWRSILTKLLQLPIKYDETLSPNPLVLKFTPTAKQILVEWQKVNTDLINDTENDTLNSIYSKLEMHIVRLALILELMRYACNESDKQAISVESIQGAIKLVEYFKKSAVKVNSIISNANPLDKLTSSQQALYSKLPNTFTTETGLKVSEKLGVAERTFKRFLNEDELFIRIKRGEYEKRI